MCARPPLDLFVCEYDAQGNRTQTTQAPGVSGFSFATQASYDALNRMQNSTDAKLGVTQFSYDGQDRPLQITDPRNLVTSYSVDGLGNTSQQVSPDTGTANATYDVAGNLSTRADSRGVLATYGTYSCYQSMQTNSVVRK